MSEPMPVREITDPRALRAMAHPLRLKLINALALHGPATATELAERVGDTPANCSWHLRQLAKFDFIEEAGDLPQHGRNRPWRWIPVGNRWGRADDSSEMVAAGNELSNALLGMELAERNAWEESKGAEPPEWQDAAFTTQTIAWLTVEELAQLQEEIRKLLFRHDHRLAEPAERPENSRPVRLISWGVPSR
jgi:DNA-binding transcriptional ArsR family regulator